MRRHTRIMLFMLLCCAMLTLTGCEKTYIWQCRYADIIHDSEKLTETVQERGTNPETVRESVESDKVTEGSTQNKKVFESSLGYSVIYDDTVFEYNLLGSYDEIGLRTDIFFKAVFFAAMKIKNEEHQTVMDQIFNNSAQQTTIESRLTAQFASRQQKKWMAAKNLKYHNRYLVRDDQW